MSCMTVSAGSEKGNRLLVLGVIDEPVRELIHFGTTIGWSIYACNEVEGTQKPANVHWLHLEYFDKVPARDAPEITALMIAPSFSCCGVADRMVEKFRVRRIAIIQLVAFPDRSNEDDAAKLFEAQLNQEMLAGDLMKDKVLDGETRLFSLPSSEPSREGHAVGAQWDKTIQDCFSWLSK